MALLGNRRARQMIIDDSDPSGGDTSDQSESADDGNQPQIPYLPAAGAPSGGMLGLPSYMMQRPPNALSVIGAALHDMQHGTNTAAQIGQQLWQYRMMQRAMQGQVGMAMQGLGGTQQPQGNPSPTNPQPGAPVPPPQLGAPGPGGSQGPNVTTLGLNAQQSTSPMLAQPPTLSAPMQQSAPTPNPNAGFRQNTLRTLTSGAPVSQQQQALPPGEVADIGSAVPQGMMDEARADLNSRDPLRVYRGIETWNRIRTMQQTPIPARRGYFWQKQSDGGYRQMSADAATPVPGGSPADAAYYHPSTNITTHSSIPGVAGPNGSFLGQDGQYHLPPTVTTGGAPMRYGPLSAQDIQDNPSHLMAQPPLQNYFNLRAKAQAAYNRSTQGGIMNLALIDAFQEAVNGAPQLAVREGLITGTQESQGAIANLIGQWRNAVSQGQTGTFNQATIRQILNVIDESVQTRYGAARIFMQNAQRAGSAVGMPQEAYPVLDPPPEMSGTLADRQAGPNGPPAHRQAVFRNGRLVPQ